MKRLIVLLFLFSTAFAYFDADSILINYGGYNTINVVHESSNAELVNFTQKIYLYPIDASIVSESLNNLTLNNNYLVFNKNTDFSVSGWKFNFTINNSRRIFLIPANPVFPYSLNDLPSNVKEFLINDSVIELTPEIKQLADSIIIGVNDYLTSVLKLSVWVHDNINYSFIEPYKSSVLSSTQVLHDRKGVCDEFSILLISLYRSEGIPARYVTGYSFGNVLGLSDFGPHAWVEAYVPNYGWVSTDPTYGEHGWLDASHVSVQKVNNTSSDYITTSYSGYSINDVNVTNHFPDYLSLGFGSESSGFRVLDVANETVSLIGNVSYSKLEVGSNEYVLLTVSVTNPSNYFIPLSYIVSKTASLELINSSEWTSFLLKPHETSKSYNILKTPESKCQEGYDCYYLHPLSVYMPLIGYFNTELKVNPYLIPTTSLNELSLIINKNISLISDLRLTDLNVMPNVTYGGLVYLSLNLLNKGNHALSNVSVNVYSDVTSNALVNIDLLGINEFKSLVIPLNVTSTGNSRVRVYVNFENTTLLNETSINSVLSPNLILAYDGSHDFVTDPKFVINVINSLGLNVPVLNLTLTTSRNKLTSTFTPNDNSMYVISSSMPISWLDFGNNLVNFNASYVDNYGTVFSTDLNIRFTREGEWYDKIIDVISQFFDYILNLIKFK